MGVAHLDDGVGGFIIITLLAMAFVLPGLAFVIFITIAVAMIVSVFLSLPLPPVLVANLAPTPTSRTLWFSEYSFRIAPPRKLLRATGVPRL